ncbi:hypothetical protein PJI17_30490, partial [Mycobacterium kansasii]
MPAAITRRDASHRLCRLESGDVRHLSTHMLTGSNAAMLPYRACCRIERAAVLPYRACCRACRIERAAVLPHRACLPCCRIERAVTAFSVHAGRGFRGRTAMAAHSTPPAHSRRPGDTLDALSSRSTPWRHTRRPQLTVDALAT